MTDIYSSKQRAIIFSVIFIASFIISLIYLFFRVDYNKISKVIFILSIIYASLFVALNLISVFDLMSGNREQNEKFSKSISDYYTAFNYIDKVLGFILFKELICYLESGQFTQINKILDFIRILFYKIIKIIKKFLNLKKIVKIIIVIGGVLIIGVALTLFIIFRKRFRLKSPIDYFFILLDYYAIFQIYINVGFFIAQLFYDWKLQNNSVLIKRYFRYSVKKIIDTVEHYYNERIKEMYEGLNKFVQKYEKDKSTPYYKYLKTMLQEIDKKIKKFEEESKNDFDINFYEINATNNLNNNDVNINNMYNNNLYNNPNNNINIYNMNFSNNNHYNNYNNIYQPNNNFVYNNKVNENNQLKNICETTNRLNTNTQERKNSEEQIESNKETKKEENNEKDKKEKKEKNYSPETYIRKYKKAIRRIEKLKKLNKAIKIESQNALNEVGSKKCSYIFIIRFIAFSIVLLTDFLLPICINKDDDFTSSDSTSEGDSNEGLGFTIEVLLTIPLSIICCSYTIVLIYATKRRRYISGDFLYDKQINDNISLMKTVQLVCGFAFALLYCNLYFWRSIDTKGHYGRPNFYEKPIIPDYTFKGGISVIMIAKILVIVISQIIGACCSKFFIFQNDLGDYQLQKDIDLYDNDIKFKALLDQKRSFVNILNSE